MGEPYCRKSYSTRNCPKQSKCTRTCESHVDSSHWCTAFAVRIWHKALSWLMLSYCWHDKSHVIALSANYILFGKLGQFSTRRVPIIKCFPVQNELRRRVATTWHVRPAKTQTSLGGSESSLSAWRNLGTLATHWAHSEDPDQTGRMPRLIWVFAGRTVILLFLSCRGSNLDSDHVFEWFSLQVAILRLKLVQFSKSDFIQSN